MNALIALKKVLSEQIASYKTLFELLKRERQHLSEFDEAGVEKVSKEKDNLILKLKLLDEERVRLMKTISAVVAKAKAAKLPDTRKETGNSTKTAPLTHTIKHNNTLPEEITLSELARLTGDAEFTSLRSTLKSLVQSLEEMNEFNKVLIDRSLSYIKTNVNFLKTLGVNGENGKKGLFITREA